MEIIVFAMLYAGWYVLLARDGEKLHSCFFTHFTAGYMAGISLFFMLANRPLPFEYGISWNCIGFEMMIPFTVIVLAEMKIRHSSGCLF